MADVFQPKFVDLVRNSTTTTGTDDFVLGPAVNGFSSFTDACEPGDQFYYAAIGVDKAGEREVGRGTLLAGGVIGRDPVSGSRTNFTSGSTSIALVAAAEWFGDIEMLRPTRQPIAVSDFKNGLYSLNGETVAHGDLWQPTIGLGAVVPGVGWTFTTSVAANDNRLPATQALNEAVGPGSGFTVVMDCSIHTPDVEGARTVSVGLSVYNEPAEDKFAEAGAWHDPPSSGGTRRRTSLHVDDRWERLSIYHARRHPSAGGQPRPIRRTYFGRWRPGPSRGGAILG